MAREYNAKYNKATLFCINQKDEEIKLKVKSDFEKFSHLFYMLRKAFTHSSYKFLHVFAEFEVWQKEVCLFLALDRLEGSKNIPQHITHKICAVELMDVIEQFVKNFGDYICKHGAISDSVTRTRVGDLCATNKSAFFSDDEANFVKEACRFYIKAIELIRQFYQAI